MAGLVTRLVAGIVAFLAAFRAAFLIARLVADPEACPQVAVQAIAKAASPATAARRRACARRTFNMWVILLEALGALALLLLIVWWTMFQGRRKGERDHDAGDR